jgi:hypothetical protein
MARWKTMVFEELILLMDKRLAAARAARIAIAAPSMVLSSRQQRYSAAPRPFLLHSEYGAGMENDGV